MDKQNKPIAVHMNSDDELIYMTVGMYEAFQEHGKEGVKARELYFHLLFIAKMQKANRVWADTKCLSCGIGVSEREIKDLKKFLKDKMGLIEFKEGDEIISIKLYR